jgi:NAD(P)-dependent dehydrogenase (short-subunit alcohol dehydrogenase family)
VDSAVAQVSAFGTRVIYVSADLKDPRQIANMFKVIMDTFGKLDVLINNAGIQYVSSIEKFPIEKWNDIIVVNLTAPFITIQNALPIWSRFNFSNTGITAVDLSGSTLSGTLDMRSLRNLTTIIWTGCTGNLACTLYTNRNEQVAFDPDTDYSVNYSN